MRRYLASYQYKGERWSFEILAESKEDAIARIGRLSWARLDGEKIASVPAEFGPLVRLAVWLQNVWSKR